MSPSPASNRLLRPAVPLRDPPAWANRDLLPAGFVHGLRSGRPLIVWARASGESGRRAFELAALDLIEAADVLASTRGLDVRHLVPSRDQLIARLQAAPAMVSFTPDHVRFTNRFCVIDLSVEHSLVLVVSAGSGRKVTAGTSSQPAVEYLASLIDRFEPCALAAKRTDRIGRVGFELAPVVVALKRLKSFICDEEDDWETAERAESRLFSKGHAGGRAADIMYSSTRAGMRVRTGRRLENGQIPWSVGRVPPPGFARLALVGAGRQPTPTMFLESPAVLPDRKVVSLGYPEVLNDDGAVIDQVENVRWFLRHFGRPSWSIRAVAEELARRKYSTCKLRELRRDQSAHWELKEVRDGHNVLRSLIASLEVYETGELLVDFPRTSSDSIRVTNLFPLDGPWADQADFDRIRAFLGDNARKSQRHTRLVLAGLHLAVDGEDAVLHSKSYRSSEGPKLLYLFHSPKTRRSVGRTTAVDADVLSEAFVSAIERSGTDGLTSLAAMLPAPQTAEVDEQIEQAKSHRSFWTAEADQLFERFLNGAATDGALRERLNAKYNNLIAKVEMETRRIDQLQRERAELLGARAADATAAPVSEVLRLVAGLRDHSDLRTRSVWRQALRDLTVTTAEEGAIRITGQLVLGDGDSAFVCPIDYTWSKHSRSEARTEARAARVIDSMRKGHVLVDDPPPFMAKLQPVMCRRLGYRARRVPIFNIGDARLMRLAMAAVHPEEPTSLAELADSLGEPVVLLERLVTLYGDRTPTNGKWFERPSEALAELYVRAATNDDGLAHRSTVIAGRQRSPAILDAALRRWDPNGRDWRILDAGHFQRRRRCRECDSTLLAMFDLREIDNPVCLRCRCDRQGVEWSADPYDRWLSFGERWAEEGLYEPATPLRRRYGY